MSTLREKMGRALRSRNTPPGEVVVKMHELLTRHGEIPDVNDCYLVRVWTDDITEAEGQDPEADVLPPVPFLASKIDALTSAREGESEDWNWEWDGTEENSNVRFQENSTTINHPIYLHFRWGQGAPTGGTGVAMLPHETASKYHEYCRHCGKEVGSVPKDCPTLRMRALADAVCEKPGSGSEYEVRKHLDAVDEWHRKSRPKEGR